MLDKIIKKTPVEQLPLGRWMALLGFNPAEKEAKDAKDENRVPLVKLSHYFAAAAFLPHVNDNGSDCMTAWLNFHRDGWYKTRNLMVSHGKDGSLSFVEFKNAYLKGPKYMAAVKASHVVCTTLKATGARAELKFGGEADFKKHWDSLSEDPESVTSRGDQPAEQQLAAYMTGLNKDYLSSYDANKDNHEL